MQLKIQNYSLFKEKTIFDIADLTLLVGANSSGKSTFLRALNTIHQLKNNSKYVKKGRASNFFHDNNSFEFSISPFVNMQISFESQNDAKRSKYIYTGDLKRKVNFLNINGATILSVSQTNIDSSYFEEKVTFYCDAYYDFILEMGKIYKDVAAAIDSSVFSPLLNTEPVVIISKKAIDISAHNFVNDAYDKLNRNIFKILESKLNISGKHHYDLANDELAEPSLWGGKGYYKRTKYLKPQNNNAFSRKIEKGHDLYFELSRYSELWEIHLKKIHLTELVNSGKATNEQKEFLMKLSQSDNGEFLIVKHFIDKWVKLFFGAKSEFYFYYEYGEEESPSIMINHKNIYDWGTGAYNVFYYIMLFSFGISELNGDYEYFFMDEIENDSNFNPTYEDMELYLKDQKMDESRNSILWSEGIDVSNLLESQLVIIEEPETNLHPDHQLLLAKLIIEFSMLLKHGKVIVETHSEYFIRAIQYARASDNKFKSDRVNIINFASDNALGKVKNIKIEDDGSLSDSFYSGFLNHSNEMQLKLLRINNEKNSD